MSRHSTTYLPITNTSPVKPRSPYVEILNPNGAAPVVMVCEHASNSIPDQFINPLPDSVMLSKHIAWDPGARTLALELSSLFDAPLVCSKISRLIYDCNRPPDSESAIPVKSEMYEIPGNLNLSESERQSRIDEIYTPFHNTLSALIHDKLARGTRPALVTVHSFTPSYFNQVRLTEIGILHDLDSRMADLMLDVAPQVCRFLVERNKPYGPEDGVTHTLRVHAIQHLLPNVMLEIKNDLLTTTVEIKAMADIIQKMLIHSMSKLVLAAAS